MVLTGPWLDLLAQDGGGASLLPDWLADAPPWVQVLALLGAMVGAVALATATVWAPALADRIRGRSTTTAPPDTGSTEAPAASPTTRSGPALQQYDAQMDLINTLVTGLQKNLDDAEAEAARLRDRLDQMANALAEARAEIGRLSYQRDMLLQRMDPRRPGG